MNDTLQTFTLFLRTRLPHRTAKIFACLGLIACFATSCGILGDKKEASRTLSQSGGACLDELGPLSKQFIDGSVSESKWLATWECMDDTIALFKKYVEGSESTGYLPDDVRLLMQRFMFSRATVKPEFVDAILSLKASVFGGTAKSLSNVELEKVRTLIRFLKDETTLLIPHLRNRETDPSATNLRAFSTAIETFGNRLAIHLNTTSNEKFSVEKAVTLFTELSNLSFKGDPKSMEQWTRLGLDVKTLLVRGATDGISGADWTKILNFGFRVGGTYAAFVSASSDDPNFQIEMVEKLSDILKGSIAQWGTELPYSEIEKIISHLPNSVMPARADDARFGIKALLHPRSTIANGVTKRYRPGFSRLLMSRSDTGIDNGALDRAVGGLRTAMRARAHLKSIYWNAPAELTPAEFTTRARAYATTLTIPERLDIERLITLANRYPGLHAANGTEILFRGQQKHSLSNLTKMNWYELGASYLLESYGTGSNAFGRAGKIEDLQVLIADLNPFLLSVGMAHPAKKNIAEKRFREANLFMPSGNGDDLMDIPETAVYFAYLFSSGKLTSRVTTSTLTGAAPCTIQGWNVPLKLPVYDIHCFRNRFSTHFTELFGNMPGLQTELAGMTPSERDLWNFNLEYASKTTGYNDDPITEFDISAYAGLPHYAEAIMQRFDLNKDGSLDRDEVFDHVFPVFKRELAKISKIKIDFVNKAVLLYLMQTGEEPKIGDLLSWAASFDYSKRFNARRIRVYQIFSALTAPAPADEISQTPPLLSGRSALGFIGQSTVQGLTAPTVAESTLTTGGSSNFDLSTVDPVQFRGYGPGPIIDPASPYQEALEVLPQDL